MQDLDVTHTDIRCPHASAHKSEANITLLRRSNGTLFCAVHGDMTEMAEEFSCDECGEDVARGDKSGIAYCGVCGREWHVGDSDYPTNWRIFVPKISASTREP